MRPVPRYISKKSQKKESKSKAPKKPKSKFLMDDDDVDVDSLDRSVGGESTASDVVENFVAVPSSSPH